jgi:hypothetical protein
LISLFKDKQGRPSGPPFLCAWLDACIHPTWVKSVVCKLENEKT